MNKKYYIFLGPQGSGKGTQAEKISKILSLPLISTGNILRKEIKDKTPIGIKIEGIMNSGHLAPDSIVNDLVSKLLIMSKCVKGAIFDGYPRNIDQAKYFEKFIEPKDKIIIIDIIVSDTEAIQRISQRRQCVVCGATYHIKHNPPKVQNICDACGSKLIFRDDDKEDTVKKRLEIYHKKTKKIIVHYLHNPLAMYYEINGEQPIDKVTKEIIKKLKI